MREPVQIAVRCDRPRRHRWPLTRTGNIALATLLAVGLVGLAFLGH